MQNQLIAILFNLMLAIAHPTKQRQSMAKLNAELDENEIQTPMFIKFSGDSVPESVEVKAGDSFELKCEAAGSPPPVFHWKLDGNVVQGDARPNLYEKLHNVGKTTVQNGITISRIVVPCAEANHAGVYKCVATNGHGRIERSIEVIVVGQCEGKCQEKEPSGPKIVEWSDARFENEKNAAQLLCRTNSLLDTIAWYNDKRELLNNKENFEVLSNGDLVIKNNDWKNMGMYTCVASNEYGEDRIEVFFYPTALEDATTTVTPSIE
ncbi:unnamed protein product [Caenorhabditis bovis]|uniref:Ig-like domain-containing protein n=1 Tax=Caenorhabditis bovis TaxID=2654633 RepID=A0A8S1EPR6_9PELO|nr:unnamed protein product [Caenorhabditis bovis]